ncbi:MAG: type II toxin-antitoxin system HicB family antitoxin [Armatimonadetes bacterium]|nr:type II toxin-antitoxin system HicB family antitoxin [Armatimonadota bacterium]
MTRKFMVRLEYDNEYKGYVANVPSLPGCMSQGRTEHEALANVEDAISLFLQSLKETGQAIPEGDVEMYTVEVAA